MIPSLQLTKYKTSINKSCQIYYDWTCILVQTIICLVCFGYFSTAVSFENEIQKIHAGSRIFNTQFEDTKATFACIPFTPREITSSSHKRTFIGIFRTSNTMSTLLLCQGINLCLLCHHITKSTATDVAFAVQNKCSKKLSPNIDIAYFMVKVPDCIISCMPKPGSSFSSLSNSLRMNLNDLRAKSM